jgi:hypothetical protein
LVGHGVFSFVLFGDFKGYTSVLATLLIRSYFRQMVMHSENNPKIIAKPDGQTK